MLYQLMVFVISVGWTNGACGGDAAICEWTGWENGVDAGILVVLQNTDTDSGICVVTKIWTQDRVRKHVVK